MIMLILRCCSRAFPRRRHLFHSFQRLLDLGSQSTMASLARSEGLLALCFRYFRQVAQHAQRELIDHREQRGELVGERFQGFGRGRAARLNDSLLGRGERGVREGQPGATVRLK